MRQPFPVSTVEARPGVFRVHPAERLDSTDVSVYLVKGNNSMQAITTSIIIQRPVEEVFAFVTDARNNPLWQSKTGLKETHQAPDSPVGVGTRITEVWNFMGRTSEDISEVTAFEPNHKYTRSPISNSGPVKGGEHLFEAVDEGTRWTSTVNVQAGGLFAIAEPLLASNIRKGFEQNMAEAKVLLEQRVADNAR
jgi:uncharacterized protein YndB with AHSA1/START domain